MSTFYVITPKNHGWGWGYGFFSNYRICLEQLIDLYQTNKNMMPYIDWSKTTWSGNFNPFETNTCLSNENPFDWWFDQKIPQTNDIKILCTSSPRPDLIDHAKHYFNDPNLKIQQLVDKLYMKPKDFILEKIQAIYEKEFVGHKVLGVMARGAEYNACHPFYGVYGIDVYIKEIHKVLKENPDITKIFIVSEESAFIEKIHKEFPNSYFMPDVFRRTDETEEYINRVHCWINVSRKRENHTRLLGEEAIIQIKLLGKCNYLFGRFCGLTAGAILWNENIEKLYICDENATSF